LPLVELTPEVSVRPIPAIQGALKAQRNMKK
jgi:hypothetical protein